MIHCPVFTTGWKSFLTSTGQLEYHCAAVCQDTQWCSSSLSGPPKGIWHVSGFTEKIGTAGPFLSALPCLDPRSGLQICPLKIFDTIHPLNLLPKYVHSFMMDCLTFPESNDHLLCLLGVEVKLLPLHHPVNLLSVDQCYILYIYINNSSIMSGPVQEIAAWKVFTDE